MWTFAWRNLLTRPLRTTLALVGLSIPILGILGLMSLSTGLRGLVGDTLGKIQGIVVLKENAFSPVLSDLPTDLGDKLRKMPGVTAVAAELWVVPPAIEGRTAVGNVARAGISSILGNQTRESQNRRIQSLLDQPILQGQHIATHENLKSAIFPRAMKEGRFLQPGDEGTNRLVISTKVARDFADDSGRPKAVGDTLIIGEEPFEIIGLYETGSMLLDVIMIMDIGTLRRISNLPDSLVSTFYVEADDPVRNEAL